MTLAEANATRKKIRAINTQIEKLGKAQVELQHEINKYELTCHHSYPKRTYLPKLDLFKRECYKCGRQTLQSS